MRIVKLQVVFCKIKARQIDLIGNRTYTDKKEAGAALIDMCRSAKQPNMAVTIGEYQGFKMSVSFDSFFSKFTISLKGSLSHEVKSEPIRLEICKDFPMH